MSKRINYSTDTIESILNILNTIPITGMENHYKMAQVAEFLKKYEEESNKETEKTEKTKTDFK